MQKKVSQENETEGENMERNFIQSNKRENPCGGMKRISEELCMSGDFTYAG